MATTFEPIATNLLGSTSTLITFASIPSTYTDLFVACNIKTNSGNLQPRITLNNDSSALYSQLRMSGTSGVAITDELNAQNYFAPWWNGSSFANFTTFNFDIFNYTNSSIFKTVHFNMAEAGLEITTTSGLYRSTTAVNRIDITCAFSAFAVGSIFTLYGIKAA